MTSSSSSPTDSSWDRFKKFYCHTPEIGLSVDVSRIHFPDNFFSTMDASIQRAFQFMESLEKGAIANPTENRMVGHYWLRNPVLAPTAEIRDAITSTLAEIQSFAQAVHDGKIRGASGPFRYLLLVGIGRSE